MSRTGKNKAHKIYSIAISMLSSINDDPQGGQLDPDCNERLRCVISLISHPFLPRVPQPHK